MSEKKVVHYHRHHHHHTPEEIMQAFTYQEQGKTIRETALLCGVSESTVKDWNRQYRIRGKAFLKSRKRTYSRYPEATKKAAVRAYLSGEDANEVAERFGILRTQSIYAWSHDERYRGGIAVEDKKKAPRTNAKVAPRARQEGMSPEEELEYLRMENAILKKTRRLEVRAATTEEKVAVVWALRRAFPLNKLLDYVGLARSTYYYRVSHPRRDALAAEREMVRAVFDEWASEERPGVEGAFEAAGGAASGALDILAGGANAAYEFIKDKVEEVSGKDVDGDGQVGKIKPEDVVTEAELATEAVADAVDDDADAQE